VSKPAQFEVWRASGDGFIRGLDAPRDADPDAVLKAFLWELEGLDPSELNEAECFEMLDCISFAPMWSVLKADREDLGDDCGEFHTDGSGARRRDAWWLENRAQGILARIVERLQGEEEA